MTSIPDESLLGQTEWLRALARALVRDVHAAEDLAQDACVIALEHGRQARELRPWLAQVLRNLQVRRGRRDGLRASSEARAARGGAVPSSLDVVAKAAQQRALVDAVLALGEPYRTTVLLRWFEGQKPQAIAARQGVPVATVRTRLQRGHALLRERLDRDHDGRGAWLGALAAWTGEPAAATVAGTSWTSSMVILMKLKLAAAAILLAGLGMAWAWPEPAVPPGAADRAGADRIEPGVAAARADLDAARELDAGTPAREEVAAVAATATPPEVPSAPPADPTGLAVLVVDDAGQPVPGAQVQVWSPPGGNVQVTAESLTVVDAHTWTRSTPLAVEQRTPFLNVPILSRLFVNEGRNAAARALVATHHTDGSGRCVLHEVTAGQALVANGTDGSTSGERPLDDGAFATRPELVLALQRPCRVEGVVLDARGQPVAGAEVGFEHVEPLHPLRPGARTPDAVRTGDDGRFAVTVDANGDFRVRAQRGEDRSQPQRVLTLPGGRELLELRLLGAAVIRGRVFDPDGAPAHDASVRAWQTWPAPHPGRRPEAFHESVASDGRGDFTIAVPYPAEFVLIAGWGASANSRPVTLRVEGPGQVAATLGIQHGVDTPGRVRDARGRGLANVTVLARPRITQPPAGRSAADLFGDTSEATSGEDGGFVLPALHPDAVYDLRCTPDPERPHRQHWLRNVVPSRTPLEIVIDVESLHGADLHVAITGPDGRPVAEATCNLWRQRDDGGWQRARFDVAAAGGVLQTDGLTAGAVYLLEVQAPGRARTRSAPFVAVAKTRVELVVPPPAAFEARVTDGRGTPVFDADVSVTELVAKLPAPHRARLTTGLDGTARGALPPGRYEVVAERRGRRAAAALDVIAGVPAIVDLRLPD